VFGERYTPSDSGSGSGLVRFLQLIGKSFGLGRPFGIELRIYWLTVILIPLISVYGLAQVSSLSWGEVFGLSAFFTVALVAAIYSHEMSHIAAGWRYGIRTPRITISPLGGLAHMDAPAPNPRADIVISLAGPAVHLVWLALVAPLYLWGDAIFPATAWWARFAVETLWQLNLVLLGFNLLPCYPMDGGRVLRALLALKLHPNRATVITAKVGMAGAVLFGIGGLFLGGFNGGILIAIGISNFMACSRALVLARHQISPYGGGLHLEPWEADPDAWKGGGGAYAAAPGQGERKPGRVSGWLARRREQSEEELKEEVDRILAKISKVGMGELTRAERKTLMRGSKAARKRR
jgi:Zn-dependent protease